MKISKLFHWLYAVLMLLPVAFIGVRCGYVMFNKNAKDSYSDTYINSSFKISNDNQLTLNTYYEISNIIENNQNSNIYYYSSISNGNNWWYETAPYDFVAFSFTKGGTNYGIRLYYYNANNVLTSIESHSNGVSWVNQQLPITFKLSNFESVSSNSYSYYTLSKFTYMADTLDNAFEYSVNQLNEVPLFSWAKDSFLVAPFSYITGLFGLASTSPINTLLSYWLSISIIWLVFDLVMYLPLLVHRWLDKGVLE